MKHKILLALAVFFCTVENVVAQDDIWGDEYFIYAENQPEYPGGEDSLAAFLSRNINYPAEAKAQRIEGEVVVAIMVEEDGTLSKFKIMKDIGGSCGTRPCVCCEKCPSGLLESKGANL